MRADDEPADTRAEAEILDTLLGQLLGLGEISAAELQHLVEDAGGIPFKAPVDVDFLTRDALKTYLREVIDSEYPPDRADADARMLIAFDLIEPGTDLRALRLKLLEQNIAGFYDERPSHRRLYAVSEDRRLTPSNQVVLAHELRHAMQDQYAHVYDALPQDIGDFDDRRLALVSLLEGDATLVMAQVLAARVHAGGEGESEAPELPDFAMPVGAIAGAPDVVRDQMALPYSIGLSFVQNLRRHGGWAAIKEAWLHPPESTDQLLHPDAYRVREHPQHPSIDYTPKGGRRVTSGVLGAVYAHTLVGDPAPNASAMGWAGDAFEVWDVSGRSLLVWRSRWQDETHAKAFGDALAVRYAQSHARTGSQGDWTLQSKGPWTRAHVLRGTDVWIVASDDRSALGRAVGALAKAR